MSNKRLDGEWSKKQDDADGKANMTSSFRQEILDAAIYHIDTTDAIKLNQNECPWDIPLEMKVRITERLIKTDWNRYPVNDALYLQKKIAKIYNLQPDQVAVANGANVLIQAIVNITQPTGKVLILDPSFSGFEQQTKLHGNPIIKVPLSEEFELLIEKTLGVIKKEKPSLILLANPNAPTGTLFDKRSLYRIIQSAGCPVVVDEAYYPFTEETVMLWLEDFNNLIVMRTFSKSMALAGVRFGFVLSSTEIATQIEKFLMPFRISCVTTAIIDDVLDHPDYAREYVALILKERARLFSALQQIDRLRVFPSDSNFLLFRVDNARVVAKRLWDEGILVRNLHDGNLLENCLRVTVGTPEENDRFLDVLERIV